MMIGKVKRLNERSEWQEIGKRSIRRLCLRDKPVSVDLYKAREVSPIVGSPQ